jgi:hypothetical protein
LAWSSVPAGPPEWRQPGVAQRWVARARVLGRGRMPLERLALASQPMLLALLEQAPGF